MSIDENIELTEHQLKQIRSLADFDLTMFLSEINDHGWDAAEELLPEIITAALNSEST